MNEFVKITEDLLYGTEDGFEKAKDVVTDKVETYILGSTCDYEHSLLSALQDCESPIEQFLSLCMHDFEVQNLDKYNKNIESIYIENQAEIVCGDNVYRVDFLIPVLYKHEDKKYEKYFVVECDGHEFHQKTKEQVERDNIRTRELQKEGYVVIRFSGSEILNKTYKCVEEIISIILSYEGGV